MPKGVFPSAQFTSDGASYEYSSSKSIGNWEGIAMSDYQIDQQIKQFTDFGSFDDLYLDVVSPAFQSFDDEFSTLVSIESQNSELNAPKKKSRYGFPSGSLEIPKRYGSRFKRLNNKKADAPSSERHYTNSSGPTLLAEIIIQLAAEKFIQSSSQCSDELSMLNHAYPSSILTNSVGDSKEVYLLSSAEKKGEKQYKRAIKLLRECDKVSSNIGSPVQRLVFYFTEALYEKIDSETGRIPLSQITKALVEHVVGARKVHIIDVEIRFENAVEQLKITVVGTKSKERIEETGRRLTSFAQGQGL
ncbi:uncharacterized protein LOC111397617 [Olea europaea var. sylvestris]|uniref:uncharacterized protein LOC111397617 n=1 Tax=Olea europaea var. sylvestris TaxID=158386 RepID=UPI000C1D8660|nr:uncharacterized protein LOC111397617 [Olea europaea var. sylvestris]